MNKYEVAIKSTTIKEVVKAQTSLEARVKFCKRFELQGICQ